MQSPLLLVGLLLVVCREATSTERKVENEKKEIERKMSQETGNRYNRFFTFFMSLYPLQQMS